MIYIPDAEYSCGHITYRLNVGLFVVEDHDDGDECDYNYRQRLITSPRLWIGIETRTGVLIELAEVATLDEASRVVDIQETAWEAWIEADMPCGAALAIRAWEGSEVIAREINTGRTWLLTNKWEEIT